MAEFNFEKILKKYDYNLPERFIAQNPASPRDSAKLLIYDRKTKNTAIDTFKNLDKYLPQNSVIIFNQTKVIPARIIAYKETGGKVELLFIKKKNKYLIFLANKKLEEGTFLSSGLYKFKVIEKNENEYLIKTIFPITSYPTVLNNIGITPLPAYIKHTTLDEKKLREQYQTVFARKEGSVAAPTASLHFTKSLINKIRKLNIEVFYVTLHVNLGTFGKLTEENLKNKSLHKEYYEIDKETAKKLNIAKKQKKLIIAVGTTVVRTLESASDKKGKLTKLNGFTNLFITEKSKLNFTNLLITNFHVPKSSLLMLVSAFIGRKKLFELYELAKKNNFRFFSFGDGMFIK